MTFDVRDFDLYTFSTELVPGEKARVEGLFRMAVEADGNFPSMDVARNHVRFMVDMESLSGVFRAIPPNSRLAMTSSGVAATAGEVLSWLPTAGVGLGALSRLVASMREIPYNRVALRIVRGTDMNIRVESMEVRSPEVLILGQGGILYEEGVDLLDQRLDLTAEMDARGEMAAILSGLGLLGGERLENGYWPGFKFRIWGDLNEPKSNFDRIVTDASTGTLTRNLTNPFHGIWGNIKYRGTEAEPE